MGAYKHSIALLLFTLHAVISFNIDSTVNRIDYRIDPSQLSDTESQFGYAIGFFNTTSSFKLLIGAPEFANKSGALYECALKGSSVCSSVPIATLPSTTDNTVTPPKVINIGTRGGAEQLGRSIRTTKNKAVVCSPMWNDDTSATQNGDVPIYGRCLTFNKTLDFVTANSPCNEHMIFSVRNDLHGYCQAGFNSEILETKNADYTVIANIGSWRYRGSLIATRGQSIVSHFTNLFDDVIEQAGPGRGVATVIESDNKNFTDIHSLLGYSTAQGAFRGPGTHGIAAGAPRQNTLYGEVLIYDFDIANNGSDLGDINLRLIATIENPDKTVGSFFGASVAAIDYNNDGYSDLVIGAPMYASGNGNLQGQDEGRVYLFRNTQEGKTFVQEDYFLYGNNIKGERFGTTIVNIGDINGDGSEDIAIGAPFGGSDGKGMVFIYNVRNGTIVEDASQIIPSPGAAGFGFSISAQRIDTRLYPVLAIGAPSDGVVYLFQAKTVITLKDKLWVNQTLVPPEVTRSNCVGPDNKTYFCIAFVAEITDTSANPPEIFDLEIKLTIDSENLGIGQRAFMLDTKTNELIQTSIHKVEMKRHGTKAINKTVFFSTEKTTDFGSPIMITTNYKTIDTKRNCDNGLCVILDKFGAIESQAQVKYLRKCGKDDICDIDLAIEEPSVTVVGDEKTDLLLIGSVYEQVLLSADVWNYNESAYKSHMTIKFNKDFQLVQISVNEKYIVDPNDKSSKNSTEYNQIKFLLANPILTGDKYAVRAKFEIPLSLRAPSSPKYEFQMELTSEGNDYDEKNNKKTVTINSGIESCLRVQLDGRVSASEGNEASPLIYDPDKAVVDEINSVADVGPLVEYNFLIQNNGRKPLENMTVDMKLINTYVNNGKTEHVSYVYEFRGHLGTQCNSTGVNDGNFAIASTGAVAQERNNTVVPNVRRRRDVNDFAYTPNLNCIDGKCKTYVCSIAALIPKGLTGIKVSFALYLSTLKALQSDRLELEIDISFGGKYGHLNRQHDKNCNQRVTLVQPILKNNQILEQLKRPVEWWIILVAVVGALIVLAIFCAILYRIGFFKRNRPEDQQALQGRDEKYEKNEVYDDE